MSCECAVNEYMDMYQAAAKLAAALSDRLHYSVAEKQQTWAAPTWTWQVGAISR